MTTSRSSRYPIRVEHADEHLAHLNPGIERSPGVTLRDPSVVQTSGGNGVRVQNSTFNPFENADVDANRVGSCEV